MFAAIADAFDLFMACRTQWRTGFGGITGLDYTAVQNVAGVLGIRLNARCLELVQVLEMAALAKAYPPENKTRAQ